MIDLLIERGSQPNPLTLQAAFRTNDGKIIRQIADHLPKPYDTTVLYLIWSYLAEHGTSSQIRFAHSLGFGVVGKPINQPSIVKIAASKIRADALNALFEVGFSATTTAIDEKEDVLYSTWDYYTKHKHPIFEAPLDEKDFRDTIDHICGQYRKEGTQYKTIWQEWLVDGVYSGVVSSQMTEVLKNIFDDNYQEALPCLTEFYQLDKISDKDKEDLLFDTIGYDGATEYFISTLKFPKDVVDSAGTNLLLATIDRGCDLKQITYLRSIGLSLDKITADQKNAWDILIGSDFLKIPKLGDPVYGLAKRRVQNCVNAIKENISIEFTDPEGFTPLLKSLDYKDYEKLRIFLEEKPNMNAITKNGDSALSLSLNEPAILLDLYQLGARNLGTNYACDDVAAFLKWFDEHGGMYDPHDPNWHPRELVADQGKSTINTY